MTLPSMSQFDAMSLALPGSQTKREDLDINVSANPFSMSYAAMAGLDMPQGAGAGQAYEDPTVSVPTPCLQYRR